MLDVRGSFLLSPDELGFSGWGVFVLLVGRGLAGTFGLASGVYLILVIQALILTPGVVLRSIQLLKLMSRH